MMRSTTRTTNTNTNINTTAVYTYTYFLLACVIGMNITIVQGRLFENHNASRISNTIHSNLLNSNNSFTMNTNMNMNNKTLCDRIHPDELPDECSCREPGPFSLVVECLKTFNSTYFNDTIGMKIDVDPCNKDGSSISLDITEKEHNIEFPITGIRAGEGKNIPIPGLSIAVPTIGNVGMDAAVLVTGNPDSLTLKIGLNACVALASKTLCASSIPGISSILPWYVLSGTYSFGDICNATSTPIAVATE